MKKAVMLFANGYEEVEALMTVDLLKRAGVDIRLVSINDDMTVTGSHGISVAMDTKLSRIQLKEEDAIIIPGGMPGTKYLEKYKPLTELLTDFYQNGGKVAAICAAPGIFERLGFLKGRNATSYPSVMEQLKSARTSLEPVVVDGNVTTSRGLGTAIDFSLSLIGQLEGSAKAEEIAESVVYVRA